MLLGQLFEAALYTNDLAAAERFYHDTLGLEIVSRMDDRGLAFRCGATVLLVFDRARTRVPDAGVPTHGATGEGHIAFVVADSRTRCLARAVERMWNRHRGGSQLADRRTLTLFSRPGWECGRACATNALVEKRSKITVCYLPRGRERSDNLLKARITAK